MPKIFIDFSHKILNFFESFVKLFQLSLNIFNFQSFFTHLNINKLLILVPSSIHGHRLIHNQAIIHGQNEQFFSAGITHSFWLPQMTCYPTLRKDPQHPEPQKLLENVAEKEFARRHMEKRVIGQKIVKSANVAVTKTANNDQRRYGEWNSEIYWQRERKSLNLNFAREFSENVAKI